MLKGIEALVAELEISCSAQFVLATTYAMGVVLRRLEQAEGGFCQQRHAMLKDLLHSAVRDALAHVATLGEPATSRLPKPEL